MRALVIREIGKPPELAEMTSPAPGPGESLLSVLAAPLNPIDASVAAGRFFGGHPPLPYIPGVEAVGRVERSAAFPPGTLAFTCLDGLGVARAGTCAEFTVARDRAVVPLPDGVDVVQAAALGTPGLAAWIPLTRLTRVTSEDIVLVLGATGTAGSVAVQAARLLGAARVVAAGRSTGRLAGLAALGADAVVNLDTSDDLRAAFTAACGGSGPTLIFDPLWGRPLRAALEAAAVGARVLHLGQSAAPEATIPSSVVRGKSLSILGYTTLNLAPHEIAVAYRELVAELGQGRIRLDVTQVPLEAGPAAWARQQTGPGTKLVMCP